MKKSRQQPKSKKRTQRTSGAVRVKTSRRRSASKSATKVKEPAQGVGETSAPTVHMEPFRIQNKPRKLLWMGAGTLLFGIISIYFYVDILLELHNYYTLIFVVPLYGYVFGDLIRWSVRGVRAVEVTSGGINVVRRGNKMPSRIDLADIGSIQVTRSLDGKTVTILLHGARSRRFLWMDYFSGPRVRIPEGPFDKQDFAEFIQRATAIVPAHRLHEHAL